MILDHQQLESALVALLGAFDQHLIQPALRNPDRLKPALHTGWRDTLAYWGLKLEMRLAG